MIKNKTTLIVASLVIFIPNLSAALYSMDFSIPGQGATHDTGADVIEPSPITGSNWTLTYGAVTSDTTTNEFITTAGNLMRVQDWGGTGTITSQLIPIVGKGTVDITGRGLSIGADAFNTVGTEGITWFYSINGGSAVEVYLGETELGGPVASGTDVGYSFSNIAVIDGDSLAIGFTVNVNGTGDGVEISAMTVDFTSVPEPSTSLLLSLAGITCLFRRKR